MMVGAPAGRISRPGSRSGPTIASSFGASLGGPPAFMKSSKSTSTAVDRPSSLTNRLVRKLFALTRSRKAAISASFWGTFGASGVISSESSVLWTSLSRGDISDRTLPGLTPGIFSSASVTRLTLASVAGV